MLVTVRHAEAQVEPHRPRRPSDAEIADVTQLGVSTVRSLRSAPQVTASLDAPVGDGVTPLVDLIADTHAIDPSEIAIAHEQHDDLSAMLQVLPDRHREVLVRRYGWDGRREESHKEIGRSLGVGEERSRQIERESLHRLRSISGSLALAA